jgi:hypothetical protein
MKLKTHTPNYSASVLALSTLTLLTAASLNADVLAQYDMETNGSRDVASTVAADLTISNLTGNNLNAYGSFTLSGVDANDDYIAWSRSAGSAQTDVLGTLADATYFTFTLTPDAGTSFSLDSISFDAAAGTAGPSDRQFYLFSDATGYTSSELLSSASTESGSPLIPYNTTTSDQNFLTDLSGTSEFQNVTTSVTFRIYIATPTTFQNVGFDDITINGTTSVIPEPSTYALLGGMSALMFAMLRRRS